MPRLRLIPPPSENHLEEFINESYLRCVQEAVLGLGEVIRG